MTRLEEMTENALRHNQNLIRYVSCRKCASECDRGKPRCGYCNCEFEFIVKAFPKVSGTVSTR